jgi:hypothetical protein
MIQNCKVKYELFPLAVEGDSPNVVNWATSGIGPWRFSYSLRQLKSWEKDFAITFNHIEQHANGVADQLSREMALSAYLRFVFDVA